MYNNYRVESQKSYKGLTASKLVRAGTVEQMGAGNWEMTTSLLPGRIMAITDSGDLVVTAIDGIECVLEMSSATLTRAERLAAKVEAAYNS